MSLIIGTINNEPVVFEREGYSKELADLGVEICKVLIGDKTVSNGGFLKIESKDGMQYTMCPDDVAPLLDTHKGLMEAFSMICSQFENQNQLLMASALVLEGMQKAMKPEVSNETRN